MIQVGIIVQFDDGWMGGINYFHNLVAALYEYPERDIEIIILTGIKTKEKHLKGFPDVKIIRNSIFDRGSIYWFLRKSWLKLFFYDWMLEKFLKKHSVDLLSHSGWIGKNSKIPTIGWIADFQHIHLPELFTQKELNSRNFELNNVCRLCSTVIVSSYDSLSDLRNFYPDCDLKYEVLQFVGSVIGSKNNLPTVQELEARYQFSGKFFLLPNQFWKHKNHRIVIEALGILAKQGKQILVLATGNTKDYRHPHYFSTLMDRAKELNVQGNFKPLGLVPAQDLSVLMRYSCAVINPSFFEGWSTTVEEAKTLGKTVVLSDIQVHREQNPDRAIYFQPTDANQLASELWSVWNSTHLECNKYYENAQQQTKLRRIEFSRRYQDIVLKTVG